MAIISNLRFSSSAKISSIEGYDFLVFCCNILSV